MKIKDAILALLLSATLCAAPSGAAASPAAPQAHSPTDRAITPQAHSLTNRAGALQARSLTGQTVALPVPAAKATVLIFIVHDCVICNRYAPEINRIVGDYKDKGIAFGIVYSEGDLPAAVQKQHADEYKFRCALLRDPKHTLARQVGAAVTPEAVVLSPDGAPLYRGRIDNSFVSFGMARPAATIKDLRDVLDRIAAGSPVTLTETRAIGCYIPTD